MISVAFESITPNAREVGVPPALFSLNVVLLLALVVDNIVQVLAIGWRGFYSSNWGIIFSAALGVEIISTLALSSEMR